MPSRDRSATAIRFPQNVHDELRTAAEEYELTVNWLVVQAVREFLANRVPADEMSFTRAPDQPAA